MYKLWLLIVVAVVSRLNTHKMDSRCRPWMTPWIPVAPLLLFKRPLTDALTPRGESGVAIPSLPKVRLLARDAWELADPRRSISNQLRLRVCSSQHDTCKKWQVSGLWMRNVLSHVRINIVPAWHLLILGICLLSVTYPWLQLVVLDNLQHLRRNHIVVFSIVEYFWQFCTRHKIMNCFFNQQYCRNSHVYMYTQIQLQSIHVRPLLDLETTPLHKG